MIPSTTEASGRVIATPTERRSTFTRAAFSAEANGDRIAHGKPFMCGRGKSRSPITPEECLASFRAGERPCVSEEHGRCSVGVIQNAKYPEDTTMGAKYGACKECGRIGNLDTTGRCYRAECKAQRWKMPGQEETPATPGDAGETGAVSGQVEPFEKIEELPARQVEPETAGASPEAEGRRSDEEVQADRTFQVSRALIASGAAMLSPEEREHFLGQPVDLPEDLDRPFEVGGIRFVPMPVAPLAPPTIYVRPDAIVLNSSADATFLYGYTHGRLIRAEDGKSIGIKLYRENRKGARRLQRPSKNGVVVSHAQFVRTIPGLVGKRAVVEATEWDGFVVARFEGGEAA